jgi:hypothetical protein
MMLTDEQHLAFLTHVTGEVHKTTFDFYIYTCPRCGGAIKLEDVQFTGQRPAMHEPCGYAFKKDLRAIVARATTPPRHLDYDQKTLTEAFPSLYH